MANYNTFLIKRRGPGGAPGAPTSLSGGELAFNEADKTLYYGISGGAGVIAIGGEGSFATLGTTQDISGAKTFTNLTTLSSTTFSPDSVIDLDLNKLTNVGEPTEDTDASTKGYVDTEVESLSSALQSQIDSLDSGTTTAVDNLSTEIYGTFVKLTDDRAVNLTGGLSVTGNASIDNLTVTGNLSVLGDITSFNTDVTTTSAFSITNHGTTTALTVTQVDGTNDVAEFKDGAATALIIKGDGNVGIGTATPNEKLTVSGNISASGTIYGAGGMEITSGGGLTTLYVENGLVGINTETPNEALTVSGSISATEDLYVRDIYARNGDFTGTLAADSAVTFGSTLSVASTVEFDSTLNVDGAVTFGSTLSVSGGVTFSSDLTGNGATSTIYGFILDGGVF